MSGLSGRASASQVQRHGFVRAGIRVVDDDSAFKLAEFDRYIEEHGIPEEDWPAAFWIAEVTGGPVPRFEKVEREVPADGVVIEGDDV